MKKDKQWLKEKLNTEKYYRETSELKAKTTFGELYDRGVRDGINAALEFVNQLDEPEVTLDKAFEKVAESYLMTKEEIWRHLERLETHGGKVTYDEPEVLSQQWIDENIVYADVKGNTEAFLNERSVRNLLVPKQEKPVIPQFVADWIDTHNLYGNNPLREYRDLEKDFNEGWTDEKDAEVYHWVNKSPYAFIDAIRYGYEVEKEKLYRIKFSDNQYASRLNNRKINSILTDEELAAQYTESEIKAIDERFWAFAEEVTE